MTDSRSGSSGRWGGDPRWAGLDEQILDDTQFPAGPAGDADEERRDLVDLRRDADGRSSEAPPADPELDLDVELDTDEDDGLDEGALPDDGPTLRNGAYTDDDGDEPGDGDDADGDGEVEADDGAGDDDELGGSDENEAVDVEGEVERLAERDPDLADRFAEITEELIGRWPEARVDPTLSRIRMLCDLLGDPQAAVPAIHLTGTNGKTSTARMTETLLRGLGLRTGTYTSPHLQDVRERILLDGRPVPVRRFVEVYEEIEPYLGLVDARSESPVSFFEALTAMGFAAFADAPVDVAVLEVGLGGRWDATNLADARVAVLTRIGVDHAHLLGDSPVRIAAEKVGVIKEGAIVVSARQDADVLDVISARVAEAGATLLLAGRDFDVTSRQVAVGGQLVNLRGVAGSYPDVFLPLHGAFQADNAACALVAAEAFYGGGKRPLRPEAVADAFAAVRSPGRLELVAQRPPVVLDAAHNPDGALAAAAGIRESFGFHRVVGVLGVMADKDVAGVLRGFAGALDEVVLTQNSTGRAMPAAELASLAAGLWPSDRVHVEADLGAAIALARALTADDPAAGVLVSGSVVTAGQARSLLRRSAPMGA